MIGWGLGDGLGLGWDPCSGPGWLSGWTGGLFCWGVGLLPGSGDPAFLGGTRPVPPDPWTEPGREPGSVRVYLWPFLNCLKPPGNGRCPGGYADCGDGCGAD